MCRHSLTSWSYQLLYTGPMCSCRLKVHSAAGSCRSAAVRYHDTKPSGRCGRATLQTAERRWRRREPAPTENVALISNNTTTRVTAFVVQRTKKKRKPCFHTHNDNNGCEKTKQNNESKSCKWHLLRDVTRTGERGAIVQSLLKH